MNRKIGKKARIENKHQKILSLSQKWKKEQLRVKWNQGKSEGHYDKDQQA